MLERGETELDFRRSENTETSELLYNLAEYSKLALSQFNINDILKKTARFLADALPLSQVEIYAFSPEKNTLSICAKCGFDNPSLYLEDSYTVEFLDLILNELQDEEVLVLSSKSEYLARVIKTVPGTSHIGNTVIVKVPGCDKFWGLIMISQLNNNKLKPYHISFFRILANTLGTFIKRSETPTRNKITYRVTLPNENSALKEIKLAYHKAQNQNVNDSLVSSDSLSKSLQGKYLADLEQSHHWLLGSSLVGIYITLKGNITRCNDRFAKMLEYPIDELLGKDLDEVFRAGKNTESRYCMLTLQNKDSAEDVKIIKTTTKNQNPIWMKCAVTSIASVHGNVTLGYVIDITEQVKVEDSLLQSDQELRALSMQLINAQENERKRVASELHDGICQSLSSIKYKIEQSSNVCGGLNCEVDNLKKFVVHKIQNAIEEVRRISMDLRPSILDDLGILETIEWQLREFQSMHKQITVTSCIKIQEFQVPENLKISIFRILQEALSNIARHANAKSVNVHFKNKEQNIQLLIEDDGVGIETTPLQRQSFQATRIGLGLKSMQERAELTGGIFNLTSSKSNGTCVNVLWPVP
jgi:PAS domain S-box-containing protein